MTTPDEKTGGERFTGHGSEWKDSSLSPTEAQLNGGFGKAYRLTPDDLTD